MAVPQSAVHTHTLRGDVMVQQKDFRCQKQTSLKLINSGRAKYTSVITI